MDMYKRKVVILTLIVLFFLIVLFCYIRKIKEVYTPTIYEKELIDYFKEITLQSEYDYNPQKVIKWREPMMLYVKKDKEFKPQMSIIKKTINEINRLATDGFKIILTEELSKSNAILYLCNKEKVSLETEKSLTVLCFLSSKKIILKNFVPMAYFNRID